MIDNEPFKYISNIFKRVNFLNIFQIYLKCSLSIIIFFNFILTCLESNLKFFFEFYACDMDYVTIQMNDLTVRFPLVRRLLKQQRWPLLLCFLFRRIRGGRMRYFKLIDWKIFPQTGGKKCLQLITVFRFLCLLSTAFCLLFGSFYSGHTIRREK